MRQIKEITKEDNCIRIVLDNKEQATFYPFAKNQVYSVVSEKLNKKTVFEFKQDIIKYNWQVDKLKENWL